LPHASLRQSYEEIHDLFIKIKLYSKEGFIMRNYTPPLEKERRGNKYDNLKAYGILRV
jgi:hypothetical protein